MDKCIFCLAAIIAVVGLVCYSWISYWKYKCDFWKLEDEMARKERAKLVDLLIEMKRKQMEILDKTAITNAIESLERKLKLDKEKKDA